MLGMKHASHRVNSLQDNRFIEESEQNIGLLNKNPALDDNLDKVFLILTLL